MSVDADTVRKVARLARVQVRDDEIAGLEKDLNSILTWVEQLQEVDCEGAEPMTAVTPMRLKRRVDEVTAGDDAEKALANAPQSAEGFFVVPKVVE